MANIQSAKKRIKQDKKRTANNKSYQSKLRTFVKKVEDKIKHKDSQGLQEAFVNAESVIAKTSRKGIIHKNTAKRKISRLAKQVKNLLS